MVKHVWKAKPKAPLFTPKMVQFCRWCRKTKEQLAVCDKCGHETVKVQAVERGGQVVDVCQPLKVPHFNKPMKYVAGEGYVEREA